MKKSILLFCILISITGFSQLAVSDPVNTSVAKENALFNKSNLLKTTKILTNAKNTYTKSKETVNLLKKAKETIEKVSSVLKNVNEIDNIIELQSKIIRNVEGNIKRIKQNNVFSSSEVGIIVKSFTNIIISSTASVDLMNKLLTNDLFKMKDAERLVFLQKIETELYENLTDIKIISNRFQSIANNRVIKKMAEKFKNQK